MAINHHTISKRRWNTVLSNHEAARAAAAAVERHPASQAREQILALYAAAADELFSVAAPTLGGLRQKLEVYWGDLFEDVHGNDFKRNAVGDLVRLELLHAGVDAEDASGGMNLEKVASDWADAAREYDHYVQLHRDGRSEAWGKSSSSDITALLDEAEAKLLSLPAPTLGAVEKKLTILLGDDRFDPIEGAIAHTPILRDLRRFITNHQQ